MNENQNPKPTECSSQALLLMAAGELPPRERPALEGHLAVCPTCREELQTLRAALADLDGLTTPAMSDASIKRIRSTARKALWPRRQMHVRQGIKKLTRRLTYAAAAVLAVGLVWGAITRPTADVPIVPSENVAIVEAGHDALALAGETDRNLLETSIIGEMLVESYSSDEWSEASEIVLARIGQEELLRELIMLEMELQLLEQFE